MKHLTAILTAIAALWLSGSLAQNTGHVIPFQGQLANQAGQPLTTVSSATLVFRFYQVPVGGVAIWEESQPGISVNAGRFSVLLGSRTLLPAPSFFNATLYLGITVEDGNPATADVELRPRQALVPVVSAAYARNADKLNGFDWSAIFGVNSPTGKIAGTKLADASITGAQIALTTITSNNIASGTIGPNQLAASAVTSNASASGAVGSQQIAIGAVGAPHIAAGGIQTTNLANGAITQAKMAPANIQFSEAVSFICDASCSGETDVPNLIVTLTTSGRPVFVGLVSGGPSGASQIMLNGAPEAGGSIMIFDGPAKVAELGFWAIQNAANAFTKLPVSSVNHIYIPTAGSHTFTVRIRREAGADIRVNIARLVAYEL